MTTLTNNDDVYFVTASAEVVHALKGNDIVIGGAFGDTLYGDEGNDYLDGGDGDDLLYGGVGNDWIIGGAGNDVLDGGLGADILIGGPGNDTYVVDNSGDKVVEGPAQGTDLVNSAISYVLPAYVENLALTGTANLNGTGNSLDNSITGNSGNNVLDGGVGADALSGGLGNDTYIIDNSGDSVSEAAGAGTDLVRSSVTFALPANVENLTLTGTANIDGSGNAQNNILTGNDAANTLDGGAGADILSGGLGNDTYIVDNSGDIVKEALYAGVDLVKSSVTYTLPVNVENLTLTGTANINGVGNAQNNVIIGNDGDNSLQGGAGADTLTGGGGADTFVYTKPSTDTGVGASGHDVITDFGVGQDKIDLSHFGSHAWTFSAAGLAGARYQVAFAAPDHLLVFDQNGDGVKDFEIQLTGVDALTAADLILS